MAGTVTSTLNLTTQADRYSYTKSKAYTDGFVVRQEVASDDAFTTMLTFSVTKGAATIAGFETLIITNAGQTTAEILIKNREWANATPDTGGTTNRFLTMILAPNEYLFMPNPRLISYDDDSSAASGGTLDNQAPNANGYTVVDSSGLNEAVDGTETAIDIDDNDFLEVGDYIRIDSEIMELTAISGDTITVIRGVQGSTKATHDITDDISLPFTNIDHDFDDTSINGAGDGSATKIKTNGNGDYHAMNLLGYGRTATKLVQGFVPGSLSIKYYTEGGIRISG